MKNYKVLAVIPARKGSKGVPKKNIKLLGDMPLIAHTIQHSLKSKYVTKTIVTTDCEQIAEVARNFGAEVPFMRDKSLATDDVPLIPDVLLDSYEKMSSIYEHDIILSLEPTYPFRDNYIIDRCVEKLIKRKFNWVVTVSASREHPYRSRIFNKDECLEPFFKDRDVLLQRQELPESFVMRGAVYATWTSNLLNKNNCLNNNWGGVIINNKQAIDIDEEIDFLLAKAVINENK